MLPQTNYQTPLPNPLPKLSTAKNKNLLIIFLLFFIASFIVLGMFGIRFYQEKYLQPKPEVDLTSSTISSPVNLKNPGIKSYGLFYFFEGNIEEIENTSDGLKIILDIPQKDIPEFIVAKPGTEVVFFKNNTYRKTTFDALKVGQKVTLATSYYSNLNRWLTRNVAIAVSELPPGESIEP